MKILKRLRIVFSILAIISVVNPVASNYSTITLTGFSIPAQAQETPADINQDAGEIKDAPKNTNPVNDESTTNQVSKVTICHATSSSDNTYVRIVVDSQAIGGHFENSGTPKSGHEDDLLFVGEVDCPQPPTPVQVFTIAGQKWNDINGNGQIDSSEPGLGDVTISINGINPEQNGDNDSLSLYHATTTTDNQGRYSFNQVPAGSYQVCETVPTGWIQTFPINENHNCHQVSTWSVNQQTGYNFGNQHTPFCGDAIRNASEQCDDGNATNYDGCDTSCHLEQEVMCHENQSQGWWGEYFDLPATHQDVNIPGTDFPVDDNVHGDPLGSWAPWTADWYNHSYFKFSRVDANLNFGDNFFPMDMLGDTADYGHNFFFAAHWRAKVTAQADADYAYTLRSDDDSWVYVDGVRFDDKDGIHPPATSSVTTMPLSAGDHIIDVFYAERHPHGATMILTLDQRLVVMPAPKECTENCYSPLDYNHSDGVVGPDGALGLSDAVEFTKRYEAALGSIAGGAAFDASVDVKTDGIINAADLLCATPYYANAGPYSCQLDCNNICSNPLDYDHNYVIGLSDGTRFTDYYVNKTTTTTTDGTTTTTRYLADLNGNHQVDYGDYACSYDQLASSKYQCPAQCQAVCGDATVQRRLGEQCDDGNITNGDGCSATCQIETNQCTEPNPLDYNGDLKFSASDAVIFTSYYAANDARADVNKNSVVDYGDYLCARPYYGGQLAYTCGLVCAPYTPICGDTHKDAGEQCDDGNTTNNDGCSATCQTEGGGGGGGPVCGNRQVETGEQCDDGNTTNGDGCSSTCQIETPAPVCGNGVKETGEQCDDGNTVDGDNCTKTCQINPGGSGGGGGGGGSGGGGGGGGILTPRLTLTVNKSVSQSVVRPGDQITYTVTIKDVGNIIGTNVELVDTMPSGFTFVEGGGSTKTWKWDTISPNQVLTASYTVKVSANAVTGNYSNLAVVTTSNGFTTQAFITVAVENPTVLGVDNDKPVVVPPTTPKVVEPVKVLGFEKLPNTSGAPDGIQILIILGALISTTVLLKLATKRTI